MNPFEYVNAVNSTKKDIMIDDVAEKAYNPFMVNRSLSYFADTVLAAVSYTHLRAHETN